MYAYPQLLANRFKHLMFISFVAFAFTSNAQTTIAQVNILNVDGKELSTKQAYNMQIVFKPEDSKQFMYIYYKDTQTADKGQIINKVVATEDGLTKTTFYWTFDTGCESELYYNGDNKRGVLIFDYQDVKFMMTFTIIE
jgi:hypothetical protein